MQIKFSVKIDKVKLEAINRQSPQKASQIVRAMALDGQRDVQQSFGTSPSAPGDPPGVDTGTLKNSVHVEPLGPLSQRIVTGVDYDVHLEFGTSKMAARPYMGPMAMRLQEHVDDYFKNFIT